MDSVRKKLVAALDNAHVERGNSHAEWDKAHAEWDKAYVALAAYDAAHKDGGGELVEVPCACPLCVYTVCEEDRPNHPPTLVRMPTKPPKGTLMRAIWDARGGPAPSPIQRGFA